MRPAYVRELELAILSPYCWSLLLSIPFLLEAIRIPGQQSRFPDTTSTLTKTANMSVNCFRQAGDKILNQTAANMDFPCGNVNATNPVVPCCAKGDTCLSNGFCTYPESAPDGSSYYVSGCTDPSGECLNYRGRCTSLQLPDVVWNATDQRWYCCGADSGADSTFRTSCDNPTSQRFNAPDPALLEVLFSIPPYGWTATSTAIRPTSSYPSSTTSTSSALPTDSNTYAGSPDSTTVPAAAQGGLTGGAKAGIGVGAALGALAVLGLVFILVLKKRRLRVSSQQYGVPSMNSRRAEPPELQGQSFVWEMDNRAAVHELATPTPELDARRRA